MSYSYLIDLNNKDGASIIEYRNDDDSFLKESWFINTITNYYSVWRGNESFQRTHEWLKETHPKLLI